MIHLSALFSCTVCSSGSSCCSGCTGSEAAIAARAAAAFSNIQINGAQLQFGFPNGALVQYPAVNATTSALLQ